MDTFVIDISSPTCWNALVTEYKSKILEVLKIMEPLISPYRSYITMGLATYRIAGGVILFEKEITEISKILGISFADCLIFQLTYEMFSACTSAILKSEDKYVHVRTMDWELPQLKNITVKIMVVNKNRQLFEAITWAGFVGIFTGIKQKRYTIALNYRRSGETNFTNNIISTFKGYYPHAFFIRTLLESNNVPSLVTGVKLISPAYYTILSSNLDSVNGTIIRDREKYTLKPIPCVQTNCDDINNGDNIMYSYERIKYMNAIINKNLSIDGLISYISQFPVTNENTIYTTIMTPSGFIYVK